MQTSQTYDLNRIFQALADPTRRSILNQVAGGEHAISDIARPYDLTFAAVSKHLKVLEAARLIDRRRDGSYQMIRLNPEALQTADQWLRHYQQFWSIRLDALKTLLEEEQEQP